MCLCVFRAFTAVCFCCAFQNTAKHQHFEHLLRIIHTPNLLPTSLPTPSQVQFMDFISLKSASVVRDACVRPLMRLWLRHFVITDLGILFAVFRCYVLYEFTLFKHCFGRCRMHRGGRKSGQKPYWIAYWIAYSCIIMY